MKKSIIILLIAAIVVTLGTVACKKKKTTPTTPQKTYSELIVGRWMTADGGHYEVYNSNGTGKMWDPADDVQEDEADTFDWTMDQPHKQFTQIVHFQEGQGDVPQYCNILILNENTLKYNNEGFRAEYTLTKVH